MPHSEAAAHLQISGRVQGVGYRYFAEETASSLGLRGWVRNLPDGKVEAEVEGPKAVIEKWISQLRKGPSLSTVEDVQIEWLHPSRRYSDFTIRL